jgi:hypothetical protein
MIQEFLILSINTGVLGKTLGSLGEMENIL